MTRLIPGISYASAPRTQAVGGTLAWPPKLIVVHATDNPTSNASGEARYAATRTDGQGGWTSAHAYVDAGGTLGSLPLDYRAWSAYSWANAHGIHIELCGVSGRVSEAVQRAGAGLVRQLCQMTGIPMRHLDGPAVRRLHDSGGSGGVCGHSDITAADFDGNDHTDPGFTSSDWVRFMGWVNTGTAAAEETDVPLDGIDRAQVSNSEHYLQALVGLTDTATGISNTVDTNLTRPNALSVALKRVDAGVAQLLTASAAEQVRDVALKAAVDALAAAVNAGGGNVDTAAITAHIDERVAEVEQRLAAAAHASADALDG